MDFSSQGIVIRETAVGESDKMLTILTPSGKVSAYAKGVKKITNKNAPATQLFVFSEYEFIKKFGRLTVKTAVSKELFYNMRSDMARYSLACYFADILNHVTMENNDETETLRLFLNALYALSNMQDIPLWLIKGAFEFKLMCICGFMPDFEECGVCACTVEPKKNNIFSFEQAAIICEDCIEKLKKATGNVPFSCNISDVCTKVMKHIAHTSQSKLLSFSVSDEIKGEFSFICENYLIHKTERSFETLKIYKSIISSLDIK